ncbi:hypothetical protein BDZ45DRAFT_741082 [Acephala macrosclerotiorum]|nr:hypothetical protein BDZ45DRAFT_741082 [Acephala macrosclerotiorum]
MYLLDINVQVFVFLLHTISSLLLWFPSVFWNSISPHLPKLDECSFLLAHNSLINMLASDEMREDDRAYGGVWTAMRLMKACAGIKERSGYDGERTWFEGVVRGS